jgi:hypothetical protein
MNHGLMSGMFWAGVLISAIPVLATVGAAAWMWRAVRAERAQGEATQVGGEEIVP